MQLRHHSTIRLFANKPIQSRLYRHIRAYIETLGPVVINATKTQVSFANRRQFAWIWLPMEWAKNRPPNSIVLSFGLAKRVRHPQIVQAVQPYPGRWMHHVIIQDESDLSDDIRRYLSAAFAFAALRKRKTRRK